MLSIIGIVLVFGCIVGGYLMERGNLLVLMQPAELLIIGGAAMGTLLVANPLSVVIEIGKGLLTCFKPARFNKALYLEHLKMFYDLFQKARRGGMAAIESDIEKPAESPVFSGFPKFTQDHHAVQFVCDTLRTFLAGDPSPFELDQLMEIDLEVHHQEAQVPIAALSSVADSLPGLGIVAAVLGVIVTMGALGGPPEQIGHKVAAALVGTFLGILLCYGLIGPLASAMSKQEDDESRYFRFLRVAIQSFVRGDSPIIAVEFARRSIQSTVRPSFQESEDACRGTNTPAEPAAA